VEGCDEEGRVVVEGIVPGDGEEEILVNVFILRTPDFLTTFIDNGVLMWVVGDGGGTRWGGKEMREELDFWGDGEWEVREDGSGRGRRGDNGNGGFSDRWQEVFYGDISKGDLFNNFFKLEVDVGILVLRGWGILKLRAYYVSLLGGNIGKDVEEVGWGGGKGQGWGAIGVEMWGRAITTRAGVVSGVVGTIKVVLDDLVGGGNVNLVDVVNLRPVSNRKGRGDNKGW
jgi:hypothetical protein